jgi:glutamate synthase (NADPH/NADH) small chain
VLVYGIPEFRLPKSIVKSEVDNLHRMGVEFETNVVVGKSVTIDELMQHEGYDAVFVATGAGLPRFLGVPGEHLNGVYSANEFLTRVNLMRAYNATEYDEPVYDCRDRDVIVVGGGNTAMDAVRTARRLGARTATLVYRRSEAEMPARAEEVQARPPGRHRVPHAHRTPSNSSATKKAGSPARAAPAWSSARPTERPPLSRLRSRALSSFCRPRGHHRRRHQRQSPHSSTTPDLKTTPRNYIVADPQTTRTSKRGVFAGGDIVTGGATVILAMGAGRKAAKGIDEYLRSGEWA